MTDNFERALEERLLARSQVSARDVEALRLFARTLPARRSLWRRPAFQWALSAAAVVLAAVITLPVLFRAPGIGTDPTPEPTAVQTQPAPSPTTPTPTGTPIVPPPTPGPSIGIGTVRLATASGSLVTVSIDDPRNVLTGAVAEQAEATMSVRWFDSIVESAGPNSIRITWVGFARDEEVQLDVRQKADGTLLLHFVQQAPPPNSDGEGEDRILLLTTGEPIDPSDVEVTFDYPA